MRLRRAATSLVLGALSSVATFAHAQPTDAARITVDPSRRHQTMEGFGVNFNGTYYRPAQHRLLDLLIDDLGATLFRFDPYGQTDWETLNDNADPQSIDWAYFADRYSTPAFEASWAAARHIVKKGGRLILNVSGTVPPWMLDDKAGLPRHATCTKQAVAVHPYTNRPSHLRRDMHEEYAETVVSMAVYARKRGVKFDLFNPVNETDCYPIEGPRVDPDEMPSLLTAVLRRMDREGLRDVRLVAADQAQSAADYFGPILAAPDVTPRLAALSLHRYSAQLQDYEAQLATVARSKAPAVPVWLTEYGDLNDKDRSADNEWRNFVVRSSRRMLEVLNLGASAALWWDAFDNYHDHDKRMTHYGLVANADHVYTPKKRFFAAKQLYRFVRPGAQRIEAQSASPTIVVSAFHDARTRTTTIVGVKEGGPDEVHVAWPAGTKPPRRWTLHLTTPDLDCARQGTVQVRDGAVVAALPAQAVFTLQARE